MADNQGQPESPTTTAGGEPVANQPENTSTVEATTAPETNPTLDANTKGAGVDGYEKMKADMLAEAAALAEQTEQEGQEPPDGEGSPEQGQPADESQSEEGASEESSGDQDGQEAPPSTKPQEFRPRLGKLPDRQKEAIALVREFAERGQSLSLTEAEQRINLKYDGPPKAEEQSADNANTAEEQGQQRTLESVKAEIADWKAKRNEAIKNIEVDTQIEAEEALDALREELVLLTVSETEAKKTAEQQQLTAAEQAWQESQARILEVYPAAAQDGPIHDKAEEIVGRLRATNNPAADSPNLPFLAYQMAANEMGIAPLAGQAATNGSNGKTTKPSTSVPLKPRPVTQQAVVNGRSTQPAVAPGGARTTQPQGPATPNLDSVNSLADYERVKASLGLPV